MRSSPPRSATSAARSARRRAALLPGEGQGGHEDRGAGRGLRRPQVDLQGALEPQRGHLHQGARSSSFPTGEEVPFRAGGYIQIECPPHEVDYKNFDVEEEYRERLGQVRPVALRLQGRRGNSHVHAPTRWPTIPRRRASSCSTSASRRRRRAPPDVPPGIDVVLHLQPEARGRGRDLRPLRRVLRHARPTTR